MALVGHAIMTMRAAVPDPPGVLNPPAITFVGPATIAGGTLSAFQTFNLIATAINQWGETIGSPVAASGSLVGGNAFTGTVALPPGATGGRLYFAATGSGDPAQYTTFPANGNFQLLSATGSPGYVPQQNSSWNPDTDGGFISAALAYKWLNDGLTAIAGAAGGIEDTTGVASLAQQLYYQIPGRWIRFNTARWDQWPVVLGDRDYIQYRYNVTGVVSLVAAEAFSSELGTIFSAFPEPGTTSATTTLSVAMGTADSQLTCVDASLFTPMSRIQIDNEIMMYSQVNQAGVSPGFITNLIRGVAGTTPATHAIGATITELKFNFNGYRYSQLYSPGQATVTLDARYEWEVPLNWWMLARAKEKEQSMSESDGLDKKFFAYCDMLKKKQANPITVAQIGGALDRGRDVGRGRIIVS